MANEIRRWSRVPCGYALSIALLCNIVPNDYTDCGGPVVGENVLAWGSFLACVTASDLSIHEGLKACVPVSFTH